MKCPMCQRENDSTRKFCVDCGYSLSSKRVKSAWYLGDIQLSELSGDCPFCLEKGSVIISSNKELEVFICSNKDCNKTIPLDFINNPKIPRNVVSAVGFRGNGKTVYFASLFNSMNKLAALWPDFYSSTPDQNSLDTVLINLKILKSGLVPAPTQSIFPIPTIVRFSNIPSFKDQYFLFYDTSGEVYAKQSRLIQYGGFIKNSRTVLFIISLDDLAPEDHSMNELLSVYIQGLCELGGDPKSQHLIVILSKADRLQTRLANYPEIWRYLADGRLEVLQNIKFGGYIDQMKTISNSLRLFLRDDLNESQFLNFANARFKSVEFCLVSALGAEPIQGKLSLELVSKRIFDPLFWIMAKK